MAVNESSTWQTFSSRNAGRPADLDWHEGVPAWLENPLREWLEDKLFDDGTRQQLVAALRFIPRTEYWYHDAEGVPTEALLDWIDAALHVITHDVSSIYRTMVPRMVAEVDAILRNGRSVWTVSRTRDSLERRHDPVVTAATGRADESAAAAGRSAAAFHLKVAWDAAFRFRPDPSTAYREAVLAVEAAAIPVVVPAQVGATLGHVLGQLDRQGHLYKVAINDRSGVSAPVTAVVQMIRILWEGHTDRHEGVTPATPITKESAQMAASLAVTLVQWFTTGAVVRRPVR